MWCQRAQERLVAPDCISLKSDFGSINQSTSIKVKLALKPVSNEKSPGDKRRGLKSYLLLIG